VSAEKRHRLFFALDPPPDVRRQVATLQRGLAVSGRAVPAANFHVTLAFLGMQPPAVIPAAAAVAAGLEFPACEVTLDRIGGFRRAGVLWLGASEIPEALQGFQHELVGALLAAGIGHDRKPWKFHLTLYRKMRSLPPTMDPVAIRWRLDGFRLVESVSVRRGVEYHAVGAWNATREGDSRPSA
jgi:2'-5' RNA ligase